MLGWLPTHRLNGTRAASLIQTPAVIGLFLVATTLVVALMIGLLGAQLGVNSLLMLPLMGMAILVLVRPIIGLYLLVVLIPVQSLMVFDLAGIGAATGVKAVGALVFVAWGLHKLTTRNSWSAVFSARILMPAVFFVLLALASLLWGGVSGPAISDLITLVLLLLLSLMVIDIITTRMSAEWLVRCLILGGLFAVLLTIQQGIFDPTIKRAGDLVSGGVNSTAVIIVIVTPLAFVLLRASEPRLWRLMGLFYIALAPLGVSLTLSRASLAMMPVALGTQFWEMSKGGFRNLVLLILSLIIVGVILITAVDWGRVLARGNTISPAIQGERTSEGRLQSSRFHHWLGGVLIFQDHPIFGVGIGNFGDQFINYQYLVPETYVHRFYDNKSRSPHSSLLGILAELGLIGGALWIWLLMVALINARRSWASSRETSNPSLEVLSQAVFYSILIYAMYSPFSVVHTDKMLWLLIGLSEVLRRLALSQKETTFDSSREALATADASSELRSWQT